MAEALGFETANIFLEKLISEALNKANFALGIESDIEDVEQSKPILEALLLDAEDMELSRVQKAVLKQLSCAVQKMDDLLDERATRAKRRRIMCGSRLTQKVAFFFSASSNPLVCIFRDARQVKAIRESLDRIARENKRVGNLLSRLPETDTETRKRKRGSVLGTDPYMISDEVIGRDGDRDKILRMFRDSAERLSVVVLVGIGGIGKTTLAQFVYNNEWVQNHFDVRLWGDAHQVFDLKEVVLKMLASASANEILQAYEMVQLKNRLITLIRDKKCLIVLDNVWDHEDLRLNWLRLESLFKFGGDGSKVLITTRSETVARLMGADDPYIVGDLEPQQSWRLFQRVAFKQRPEPHLEVIGQEIAHLCRNVPLVIHITGRLLREKDATVVDWRNFRDELARRSCCDHETSIMQPLKLSYDQLDPSGLKLCFVLWSLFWKGFGIEKRELLYLWRALGYIETHKNESVVHAAEDYFFRLKSRGLLLEGQNRSYGKRRHEIGMHDVIHDLAISLGKSKYKMVNSTECDFDEETRHVSFSKKAEFSSQDFPSSSLFKIKHQLQSLLVLREEYDDSLKLKLERLSEFERLRIFVLQNAQLGKMPSSIGKLIHLRYLDLSGNKFKKLPDSITELVNLICLNLSRCRALEELPPNLSTLVDLETLDLQECRNLQELPRDISKLGKLRHLRLKWCGLKHMPSGLGKLTGLQTLETFVVGGQSLNDDDVGGLAELNRLNNLEGELEIVVDGCGLSESEARAANLQAKEKLTELYIEFREGLNRDDEEVMLEGLQPHSNLRDLVIYGYKGERSPSWIVDDGYLLNLERIEIRGWKGCSFLGSFGRLPHLKSLKILDCKNVEYIERNTSGCSTDNVRDGDPTSEANEANADHNPNANPSAPSAPPLFPSLEKLALRWLPKLKGWRRSRRSRSSSNDECFLLGTAATAFPRLKTLEFQKVGLEVVPEDFRGLSSLDFLDIDDCEQLKEIPEWMDTLTSLKELKIWKCTSLKSLPKQIANLANLKTLSIGGCPGLASLESLDVNYGEQIKEIPERRDTLTSLEALTIWGSTSLKSLPKQIANLTNLNSLSILNCPGLAERCRKPTGEDWPLIQHVPCICIYPPTPNV